MYIVCVYILLYYYIRIYIYTYSSVTISGPYIDFYMTCVRKRRCICGEDVTIWTIDAKIGGGNETFSDRSLPISTTPEVFWLHNNASLTAVCSWDFLSCLGWQQDSDIHHWQPCWGHWWRHVHHKELWVEPFSELMPHTGYCKRVRLVGNKTKPSRLKMDKMTWVGITWNVQVTSKSDWISLNCASFSQLFSHYSISMILEKNSYWYSLFLL